jgi:hypothetical protein
VVEARRWVADPANAALKGDALTTALAAQDWAPSVKSLVPFPDVLQMMDSHLDWMQRLGEAFLAQQADVMDAVQRMRYRAQSAGTLGSSIEQTVTTQGDAIAISPPATEVIYVPAYDPWCVYGPWPYPLYPPYYFTPWPGHCASTDYVIGFGAGIFWPFWFWEWGYFDWHHHHIRIHRTRFYQFHSRHKLTGDTWHFEPTHRDGVPFRDQRNVQRFAPQQNYQRSFRGYMGRGGQPLESSGPAVRAGVPSRGQPSGRQFQPQQRYPSARGQPTESVRTAPREGMPFHGQPSVRQFQPQQTYQPSVRVQPAPSARQGPPAFSNYGRGSDIRMQSQFGQSSRQGTSGGSSRSSGGSRGGQGGGGSFRGGRH